MNANHRWASIAGCVIAALALLWFFLNWGYILRSNPALFGVLGGLFGPWYLGLTNLPPLELVQAIFHTALCGLLGWWLLEAMGGQESRSERVAAGWVFGLGVAGIAFELLIMARWFYVMPTWILWGGLLGGAWWLRQHSAVQRWALEPVFDEAAVPDERLVDALPWRLDSIMFWALAGVVATITFLTFYHALLFPETYWDSLILYLGYGRMTFMEHGFPFKAEVQVGIGLGANYPHLFSSYGAIGSMLFGHWSDVHQRMAGPVAGLATCVLLYGAVRRLAGSPLMAIAAVALFRAVPYGVAYHTWASDYALAIVLTALLMWTADRFLRGPSRGNLLLMTLVPAISMHLNYLMGLLWFPWGVAVLAAAWRDEGVQGILAIFKTRRIVLVIFMVGVLLASPWYIRNWALTGNPVYAFFPQFFPASVRMNVEVLRSAELEWYRVGDGIGKSAELFRDLERGERRDEGSPDFRREATLADRLKASFFYWVGFETFHQAPDGGLVRGRLADRVRHLLRPRIDMDGMPSEVAPGTFVLRTRHAYKMSPFVPGALVPAVLLALLLALPRVRRRLADDHEVALLAVAGVLVAGFFAYNYLLADFYLYQIIAFLPPATILIAFALGVVRRANRWLGGIAAALVLASAIVPGLPFTLMNFKAFGTPTIYGVTYNTLNLDHMRQPAMPASLFMRLRFGDDVAMWEYINQRPEIDPLLTHDNRHYVYRPGLTIVHLDDWDVQQLYGSETPADVARGLADLGLRHYLYIDNEDRHTINSRLRMRDLETEGFLRELYRSGNNVLFEIVPPDGS